MIVTRQNLMFMDGIQFYTSRHIGGTNTVPYFHKGSRFSLDNLLMFILSSSYPLSIEIQHMRG